MATSEIPPAAQDRGEKVPSILLVEDDAMVSTYVRNVLEESGFVVSGVASSGPEAVSLASEVFPDLALVDIKLAGPMDGIEVAQLLNDKFGVRSIFLSGVHDPQTMERAKVVNPLGYLQKPFRPSQVFNALEKALAELAH